MGIKDIKFIQQHAPGQQFELYDADHKMIGRLNIIHTNDFNGQKFATEWAVEWDPPTEQYPYDPDDQAGLGSGRLQM